MNSKFGMFSVLVLGIMMLLIPATSMANAQEYDDRYYEDKEYKKIDKKSYNEPYKKEDERKSYYKDDNKKSEEPVIIIKNEPIQKKEKKKMKEPPMLVVKKDVLYCDNIANGNENLDCDIPDFPGPDSDRYVQECTANGDLPGAVCNTVNEEFFNMIVTDNIEFPGSEDGKKITFNGERYTVSEETVDFGEFSESISFLCQEAGFDGSVTIPLGIDSLLVAACIVFEGECSGIVQDGELKECTLKNYIVSIDGL